MIISRAIISGSAPSQAIIAFKCRQCIFYGRTLLLTFAWWPIVDLPYWACWQREEQLWCGRSRAASRSDAGRAVTGVRSVCWAPSLHITAALEWKYWDVTLNGRSFKDPHLSIYHFSHTFLKFPRVCVVNGKNYHEQNEQHLPHCPHFSKYVYLLLIIRIWVEKSQIPNQCFLDFFLSSPQRRLKL